MPPLVPAIRKVEIAQAQVQHDRRWNEVRAVALVPTDEPEKPLAAVQAFLREFPDTSHRNDALALVLSLRSQTAASCISALERKIVDHLIRLEGLPTADFRDLIEHVPSNSRRTMPKAIGGARSKRNCKGM